MVKEFKAHGYLVAACGLYCGCCDKFLHGKCPGCGGNSKATWCGVRNCCLDEEIDNCACCKKVTDPLQCARFNNFFSRIAAWFLNSNRAACIARIKQIGREAFAAEMHEQKKRTLPFR